jgi:hypothetical protein
MHRAFGIGSGAKQDRIKLLSQLAVWILAEMGMVAKDGFDHEVPIWPSNHDRPTVTAQHLRLGNQIMITGSLNLQPGLCHGAYCTVMRLRASGIVVQLADCIECLQCRSAGIGN